jgi:hypothetical protein
MEAEIRSLDRDIEATFSNIQILKRRLRAIESGSSSVTTSDYAYDQALRQHNDLVGEYNALLARRERRYNEYESALAAANARIQRRNASPSN